jgi:hypothetical protein
MHIYAVRHLPRPAFVLLAASLFACTPSVNRLGVSQEVVDNLPKGVALRFLITVHSSGSNPECLFQSNGVQVINHGKIGSQTTPYSALSAGLDPGAFGGGHLSVAGSGGRVYCLFGGFREASRQKMDNNSFLEKVFTALFAVGVRNGDA